MSSLTNSIPLIRYGEMCPTILDLFGGVEVDIAYLYLKVVSARQGRPGLTKHAARLLKESPLTNHGFIFAIRGGFKMLVISARRTELMEVYTQHLWKPPSLCSDCGFARAELRLMSRDELFDEVGHRRRLKKA